MQSFGQTGPLSWAQSSPHALNTGGGGLPNMLPPGSWAMSTTGGTAAASESPDGTLNLTGDGTNRGIGEQQITLQAGEEYRFQFTVADGSVIMRVGTTQGGSQVVAAATRNIGVYDITFTALAATTWVRFDRQASGTGRASIITLRRVVQNPLRVAANKGVIPTINLTAAANSLRAETRKLYVTGGHALSEIKLAWAGFLATATTENTVGNNQSLQAAIEIPGAPTEVVRVTFAGSNTGQITNGQNVILSDKVLPSSFGLTSFAAGTSFYVREQRDVTLGQVMSAESATANMTGESTQLSDGASPSQLMNSGALSTPTGGSAVARRLGPTAVLGRAVSGSGDIAVLDIGDSLLNGANDTNFPNGDDGTAGGGFIKRALRSCDGRSVPHLSMAFSGSEAQNFQANMARRSDWMAFCTHLVENYGTNDFGTSGRTAAQVYADRQTIWTRFKSRAQGAKRIAALPILIRTNSTDSFATTANQTPRTGFENGGTFKEPMNANLAAAVTAGYIEEVIDINPTAADSVATDEWKVTGAANYATSDGTHPSPAMSELIAVPVSSAVAAWA